MSSVTNAIDLCDMLDIAHEQLIFLPSSSYKNGVHDRESLEWLEDFRLRSLSVMMPIHKATWLRLYGLPMDTQVSSWGDETRSFNDYTRA